MTVNASQTRFMSTHTHTHTHTHTYNNDNTNNSKDFWTHCAPLSLHRYLSLAICLSHSYTFQECRVKEVGMWGHVRTESARTRDSVSIRLTESMRACMSKHAQACMYVWMDVCMDVRMYVCYVCMYVMYVCMHACMLACSYVCMHACMHACMLACMHACMLYTYMLINDSFAFTSRKQSLKSTNNTNNN